MQNKKHPTILILCLILTISIMGNVHAKRQDMQKGRLIGQVIDESTQIPLVAVNIMLEDTHFEDYTFDHWEGYVEQTDQASTSMVILNNQSVTAHVNTSSGVNPVAENFYAFHLYPVYPNPFNPATTIRFTLDSRSETIIRIYNLTGRIVKTLASDAFSAGRHEIQWNGTNVTGMPVPSGMYMVKIETEKFSSTRKMILLK